MSPTFRGLGTSRTGTIGYVVIPMSFPSVAAMSGDERVGEILQLPVEFQVVTECDAGFLIGRDVMRGYKMKIDETQRQVVVSRGKLTPFKIPITDGSRYEATRFDPRVYAMEAVTIKPGREEWIPV
jgi:hypothetical protein